MPVVLANLPPAALAEIQRLVEKGLYESAAEFLELAAANQLQLEREGGPGAPGKSRRKSGPKRERPEVTRPRRVIQQQTLPRTDDGLFSGLEEGNLAQVRERLALPHGSFPPAELALKPPMHDAGDGRIWGQINRFLPLKVPLRWLAVHASNRREWSPLEEVLEPIAADAAALGSALEQADADADRNRDELIATGLPRRGNNFSTDRFLSQYLARTTRKGTIHPGAAVQYGFASIDEGRLALTTTGFEFASLTNPVMDGDLAHATVALSEKEREFLVSDAIPYVSSELHDFSLVMSFVDTGHDTPNEQLELLGEQLPEDWSDTQLRTHVTGVVARMVDLGLLRRRWEGRRVQYLATELGAGFSRSHSTYLTPEGTPHA